MSLLNKHTTRRRALQALGGSSVALLAGCLAGETGGDSEQKPVIGALQPYSGPFAAYSRAHQAGLEFAVQEENEAGDLPGGELSVSDSDTEADASTTATLFQQKVSEENIVAATGPVGSGPGIRAGQTAEQEQVPLFYHAVASIEALSKDKRYNFRTGVLPAASTMKAAGGFMQQQNYNTIGGVIADNSFGQSIKSSAQAEFPDSIDLQFEVAPFTESDFSSYLRSLPDNMDAMIGTGHPAGVVDVYKKALDLGVSFERFTGSTAPDFVYNNALGDSADEGWMFFHQADVYSQEFQDLAGRYAEQNNEYFGTTHGIGYVTGKLIAKGLREAGEVDSKALADAVRNMSLDTIYAKPIKYTKFGELKDQVQIWSEVTSGAPEYYSDGKFSLNEVYRSDPLPAYQPGTIEI